MKTLVEMAQELGIQPKSDLTATEWRQITRLIGGRLLQETTGLPPDDRHEVKRRKSPDDLPRHLYILRKHVNRRLDAGVPDRVAKTLKKGKEKHDVIFIHPSRIGFQSLEESPFIFHSSMNQTKDICERFVADIDPSSPALPRVIADLDRFIQKYHAKFKMPNKPNLDRTDTLNVYVSDEITPQMAQDFIRVVRPALSNRYHDKLDGLEIFAGDKPVKGIKIGPELDLGITSDERRQKYENRLDRAVAILDQDIKDDDLNQAAQRYLEPLLDESSLGQKMAALQVMDLMYYAMGKQNPFRLMGYDEKPYDKKIVVPADVLTAEQEKPTPKPAEKKMSLFARFFAKREAKKPEADKKIYWSDPLYWRDVKAQTPDGVAFGHRIRLDDLSPEQQRDMEERLTKMNIRYAKRQATQSDGPIRAGDWTLRVIEPDSVRQLRRMVFRWAEGGAYERPVFMTTAEYAAHQKQMAERMHKNR